MNKVKYNMGYVWLITIIAAMGGLLFGYDWVVIGGAKPFYERYFNLTSSFDIGWAMSSAIVGCLIGTMVSGFLADKFGRKPLLIFAALLFILTGIGTALAQSFNEFIWYRIIGGVAIGMASNLSPMFIAEIAPAKFRGLFVSINQLTIVIGIVAAQAVNWLIAEPVPDGATSDFILNSWNGQVGWRYMFGVEAIPAFLFFVLLFFVPESPRWLLQKGKDKKVEIILTKIGGQHYSNEIFKEINDATIEEKNEKVNLFALIKPGMLGIAVLGVVIAVFQQWCGINIIFNYAEEIFSAAGYKVSDVLFNIVITGAVNLVFTFIALFTVDKWGRRKLMLTGSIGLALSYTFLGFCYFFHITGILPLMFVLISIALYAMSLGPVAWVIISEIFPNKIRGAAMAVSVFALWAACFVLTYTFPILNYSLGTAKTFWIYAIICLSGFIYTFIKLPETKGKSLEEIEHELIHKIKK